MGCAVHNPVEYSATPGKMDTHTSIDHRGSRLHRWVSAWAAMCNQCCVISTSSTGPACRSAGPQPLRSELSLSLSWNTTHPPHSKKTLFSIKSLGLCFFTSMFGGQRAEPPPPRALQQLPASSCSCQAASREGSLAHTPASSCSSPLRV